MKRIVTALIIIVMTVIIPAGVFAEDGETEIDKLTPGFHDTSVTEPSGQGTPDTTTDIEVSGQGASDTTLSDQGTSGTTLSDQGTSGTTSDKEVSDQGDIETDPIDVPDDPNNPSDSDPAVGSTFKVSGFTYKVTSVKAGALAVSLVKSKNAKAVTVPASVKYKSKTYKVTAVNTKAFTGKKIRTITVGKNVRKLAKNTCKGSKATKLILKTTKLSKSRVKGSLKGSKVKIVKVKVSTKKATNKKWVKKYKKYFTKANAGKKVKVTL